MRFKKLGIKHMLLALTALSQAATGSHLTDSGRDLDRAPAVMGPATAQPQLRPMVFSKLKEMREGDWQDFDREAQDTSDVQ